MRIDTAIQTTTASAIAGVLDSIPAFSLTNPPTSATASAHRKPKLIPFTGGRIYACYAGEGHRSRPCEGAGELGEDGQVGVKPDPFDATDAER
jgi:hypothetical protein